MGQGMGIALFNQVAVSFVHGYILQLFSPFCSFILGTVTCAEL